MSDSNPAPNSLCQLGASDYNQQRRRKKLLKIALLPCYIPIACVLCLYVGGKCLWCLITGRPFGGYCGNGSASAKREYAQEKERKKAANMLVREAPPPLPKVRKRALSIPLPVMETTRTSFFSFRKQQKTSEQLQSTVFRRLPLEVRELIWRNYVSPDGEPMHVFRRTDRRLGCSVCTSESKSHSHYPSVDWGYHNPSRTRAWKRNGGELSHTNRLLPFANRLLPLLKSCRRIYSEVIPLLYSSNTFCFQDIGTLRYFVRTVLPIRLNSITAVQLPWMKTYLGFPQPNGELDGAWEALRQMHNLQTIHIVQFDTQSKSWLYRPWTDWISHMKRKLDAKVIGDQSVPPVRFALRMSMDEEGGVE